MKNHPYFKALSDLQDDEMREFKSRAQLTTNSAGTFCMVETITYALALDVRTEVII